MGDRGPAAGEEEDTGNAAAVLQHLQRPYTIHSSVRRLRRENRILRREVLQLREEQTAWSHSGGCGHGHCHAEQPSDDGGSDSHKGHSPAASPRARGPPVVLDADNEAMQMRLKTLTRQNERERARHAATERELRHEIELLRLALDDAKSGFYLAEAAAARDGTVGGIAGAAAVNDPLFMPEETYDDGDPFDSPLTVEQRRRQHRSSMPAPASPTATTTATTTEYAGDSLTSAGPRAPSPDPTARTLQALTGTRVAPDDIAAYDRMVSASWGGDGGAAEGSRTESGTFVLPDVSSMLARTAGRRELRRRRLQEASANGLDLTGVLEAPSGTSTNPGSPVSPEAKTRGGAAAAATVTHVADLSRGAERKTPTRHHRRGGRAPGAGGASSGAGERRGPFNPNQIGVDVTNGEKNRSWYLYRVLAETFLYAIRPRKQPPPQGGPHSPTATTAACSSADVTAHSAMGSAPASSSSSSSSSRSGSSSSTSSRSSSRSSSSDSSSASSPDSSSAASSPLSLQKESKKAKKEARRQRALEKARAEAAAPLLYREIHLPSLLRAIDDVFHLQFRCQRNVPTYTTGPKRPAAVPDFAAENTDPTLISVFGNSGTAGGHGGSGATATANNGNSSPRRRGNNNTNNSGGQARDDEVHVTFHAPVIFKQLRAFLGLDVKRFCAAVERSAWRQSMSPGKSGTTLFYFGDYVMKSMHETEYVFFTTKFLPSYVQYCERNPHTLLPRFYAVVSVKWIKMGTVVRFVLMHNVFATSYYINRIFDVKGSSVNRTALVPGKPPPRTAFGALLLKDNDLPPHLIVCGAFQKAFLVGQLRSDVNFLQSLYIVDYSCMIGVRSRVFSSEEGPSRTAVATDAGGARGRRKRRYVHGEWANASSTDPTRVSVVTDSAARGGEGVLTGSVMMMPPPGAGGQRNADGYMCLHGCDGGLLSLPIYTDGDYATAREDVYYIGIIDVLQEYNTAKRLESLAKGIVNDRSKISVVPPKEYAERLYQRISAISL